MALKTTKKLYLALSISKQIGSIFYSEKYLLYSLINVPTNFTKKIILVFSNGISLLENYF